MQRACAILASFIAISSLACTGRVTGDSGSLDPPDAADARTPDPGAPDAASPDAISADGAAPDAGPDDPPPPPPPPPPPDPTACNGAAALCDRRYDQVAYATTHNAMSSVEDGWFGPNQHFGMRRQLADGVRGLMLDVHVADGEVRLCHGRCFLGSTPLVDGLVVIREFLDAHRREVVTIIFESYAPADQIAGAFEASGLLRYVRPQARDAAWPTLGELIDADQRLVVFTDRDGGAFDWYLPVFSFAWETHFAARTVDDLRCDRNRGADGNPLFILNHFLTNVVPLPDQAPTMNGGFLLERARACQAASGRLPNFVTVDFYSVGAVFDAVRALNGV